MNLLIRLNLALGVVFVLGSLALGIAGVEILRANSKHEALREASLMMDGALAIRAYTSSEIVPLLNAQLQSVFLPQSVPSYAATQNFLRMRDQHPEYSYKEATLNPTNPRDRATDWETDIVQKFRDDPQVRQVEGERDSPLGRSLYLARPIRALPECLGCHGPPAAAPRTVVALYGSSNGFGWQPNEVIGAQIVSVPLSRAVENAERLVRNFMLFLAGTCVASLLIVNGALYFLVLRPIRHMAAAAEQVSLGDSSAAELPERGGAEIATLARAFNRMRRSLDKTLQLLEP